MVFGPKSCLFKAGKILKSQDDVCPTLVSEMHLDNDEEQKTRCGGIITIVIKLMILNIVVSNGVKMVQNDDPYYASVKTSVVKSQNFTMQKLNQIHFAVIDINDKYYSMEETKRYIDIQAIHKRYTYDNITTNLTENVVITKAHLEDCHEQDFKFSDESLNYWRYEVLIDKQKLLCLDKKAKELHLEGNIQSNKLTKETNAYFSVQIFRCDRTVKNHKCATHEQIDKWLEDKQLEPLSFDFRPNMKEFDKPVITEFKQFQGLNLYMHEYTDVWFRFVQNKYERKDMWYNPKKATDYFPSIVQTYRNIRRIPKESTRNNDQIIARIIYRNEYNMMEHTRQVMQIEDFLGMIAGVQDILILVFMFVFGAYVNITSKTKWIKNRYFVELCRITNQQEEFDQLSQQFVNEDYVAKDKSQKVLLDMNKISPTRYYYRNISMLRFFCLCCRKSKEEFVEKQIIEDGIQELENDFNFVGQMERDRKCDYETEKLESQKIIDYDDFLKNKILVVHKIKDEAYKEYKDNLCKEFMQEFQKEIQKYYNIQVNEKANSAHDYNEQQAKSKRHGKQIESKLGKSLRDVIQLTSNKQLEQIESSEADAFKINDKNDGGQNDNVETGPAASTERSFLKKEGGQEDPNQVQAYAINELQVTNGQDTENSSTLKHV